MQPFSTALAGTPSVDSQEFWKQPYRVEASSDPDTLTAQTVGIMCGQVRKAAQDHIVQKTAADAAWRFGGMHGTRDDALGVAGAAFWWCKIYVKFIHHEFIIRERLGESGHLQGLISPEILVRMERPEGDCAIFSECVAAFLKVFGIPYEFVTVAVNPNEPEIFSHVYLYAILPDGSRLPLDASDGKYPGWQAPSSDVSRRQVWDADGNPVADRGSRFDGLHNYAMRGLGVDGDYGGEYTPYVAPELPADAAGYFQVPTSQTGPTYLDMSGAGYSGPAYTVPSQSNSAAWGAFANSLKGVLSLAQMYALKPGMVISPNGTVLQQNPGYPVGTPTGAFSLGTGLSTSTLMLGGLALVAILFMSGRR